VLVSNLYLSIRSLSPENYPSSLPPDLTALVLTLFEVGGVDSMMAEKKQKKKHTQELQEMLQEMVQLVVLVKEISCNRFYSKNKIIKHSVT